MDKLTTNQLWQMDTVTLIGASKNPSLFASNIDLGDVTVVCNVSNQAKQLERMIKNALVFTNKFLIVDDCSVDNTIDIACQYKAKIISLPEGWIYTHGLNGLYKLQDQYVKTKYAFRIDAPEQVFITNDCTNNYGECNEIILIQNFVKNPLKTNRQCRFYKVNKHIKSKGLIHCVHPCPSYKTFPKLGILIIDEDPNMADNSQIYLDRRNRLYIKLLKKSVVSNDIAHLIWAEEWNKNKDEYNKKLKKIEDKIGLLKETTEKYKIIE